jgi:GNAT superfamily N-acetyltransferase
MAAYKQFDTNTAQITVIAVVEKHRRKGIASSLISHVEESINPYTNILYLPCHPDNKAIINCAKKHGFRDNQSEINSHQFWADFDEEIPGFHMKKSLCLRSCYNCFSGCFKKK